MDALRTAQPHGPYTVGGWSYGAVVAHEVARQLTAAGETVDVLLALDGYPRTRAELAREVLQIPLARRDLRRTLLAKYGLMARYRPAPAGCPALLVTAGRTRPPLRLRHLYDGVRVLRAAGRRTVDAHAPVRRGPGPRPGRAAARPPALPSPRSRRKGVRPMASSEAAVLQDGLPEPSADLRRNWNFQALWTSEAFAAVAKESAEVAYPLLILATTGSALRRRGGGLGPAAHSQLHGHPG